MDTYFNYKELHNGERIDEDYRISIKHGSSGIAIIVPHGGEIEPGTSEIAQAVAGTRHTFYAFEGLKPRGNWALHIASTRFDEPLALKMVKESRRILTIHGCKGREKMVYIGGRDRSFKRIIKNRLHESGFKVAGHPRLGGCHPRNICNRNIHGMGVQLEITTRLRVCMFESLTCSGRRTRTKTFDSFVSVLRNALEFIEGDLVSTVPESKKDDYNEKLSQGTVDERPRPAGICAHHAPGGRSRT